MKVIKCKHLGSIQGIILAPFCILIRSDKIDDAKVLKHETKHWIDAKRLWYIGFYISYFVQWIFKGYSNISFEIEANKAELI